MSRIVLALCALLVTLAPRDALSHPALPDDFQRPDAHRQAISAVLGDLSFLVNYGRLPASETDGDLRIRTHLEFVYDLLSRRDLSAMPAGLRMARRGNLASLR